MSIQLTQLHENPAAIAFWGNRLESLLTWLTPLRRRQILLIGAIYIGIRKPLSRFSHSHSLNQFSDIIGALCAVIVLFVLLQFIHKSAIKFKSLPVFIRQHPYLTLHLFFWAFLSIIWLTSPYTGWWRTMFICIAGVLPYLIWRCCYVLQSGQTGRALNTTFFDHLFYLWPAFGGSNTPFGKGYDYLSRVEAKTNEELARSQLSGIKLILLSLCWSLVAKLMNNSFYGSNSFLTTYGIGIPQLSTLINMGSAANIRLSWISLYCELIYHVLKLAASGHMIVGVLRIFGFNVFRNTYKPLLAESIVEFWNRYFYYFKELLSIFFFIPTFMQLGGMLKKWPTIRLFSAVFAAAFVGNMYYHILLHHRLLISGQILDIFYSFRSRFFYCFLLALGIFVSMWRIQKQKNKPILTHWWAKGLRIFGVWTFFSLIYIWNVDAGDFMIRVAFFCHLFGF